MTRHCHNCGLEWTLSGNPGRSESCPQCRADFRCCLNCLHHDLRAAHQCRERRAEPVEDKQLATFCEYFDFVRREFKGKGGNSREDASRAQFKKLFGD